MELVLVRHAEPEWIRDGLSVDDPPLTERGRRQAEMMARHLAGSQIDQLLVSPLRRAAQTAAPVAAHLGVETTVAPWLEEIRNPIWHGTPAEKAEEAFRSQWTRPARERWAGLEGGEPVRDFVDRIHLGATLFLAERGIERTHHDLPVWRIPSPGERICVVAHAGTNSVIICHLLGLEPTPWEWERFVLHHASVSRLEALELGDGFTFSLTKLSDVEHLGPQDRTR